MSCPCGSGAAYGDCCEPFLAGKASPVTAEALMRSRYTAYAMRCDEYLVASWHPTTRQSRLDMPEQLEWLGLEIDAATGGVGDHKGCVEFVARYRLNGQPGRLRERSRFARHHGRWFYVTGDFDDFGDFDDGAHIDEATPPENE